MSEWVDKKEGLSPHPVGNENVKTVIGSYLYDIDSTIFAKGAEWCRNCTEYLRQYAC